MGCRWKVIPVTLNKTAKADPDLTVILRWKNHMVEIISQKKKQDRWVGVLVALLSTVKETPKHSSY